MAVVKAGSTGSAGEFAQGFLQSHSGCQSMMDRTLALEIVLAALRDAVDQNGGDLSTVNEETAIVGPGAVIDSIGVVSLIVDIEQRLEMDHQVSVTLANDRAMSQRNSPFRTAAILADHIITTEREGAAA
jgi:acyl carrier protein